MLTITLPDDTARRLEKLAKEIGIDKDILASAILIAKLREMTASRAFADAPPLMPGSELPLPDDTSRRGHQLHG